MTALFWILGVYLGILILVVRLSLYPLRIPTFISPGSLGLPQENVEFTTEDGMVLRGWWVQSSESDRVAVFTHGYLMNRCEWVPIALQLHRLGYSCLLYDLRAHGRSRGKKCGLGWYERQDVRAAARFARSRSSGFTVLLGSSMGAAASAFALAEEPGLADALVMDSSYSQLQAAVLGWWSFIGGKWLRLAFSPTLLLTRLVLGIGPKQVDVARALELISIPKLFVHGSADTLAEPSQATRNFEAAATPKELFWFADRNHSEFRWEDPDRYLAELTRWLEASGSLS